MMRILGILAIAACCAVIGVPEADARGPAPSTPVIAASRLPAEAQKTLALIRNGGPFPYLRDGAVFGNRERLLPQRPRGYYHEFTVKTPGAASGSRYTADRFVNRLWHYPRRLARLRGDFDVFHIVDHSYSQLVHVVQMRHAPGAARGGHRDDFALTAVVDHIVRFSAAGFRAHARTEIPGGAA